MPWEAGNTQDAGGFDYHNPPEIEKHPSACEVRSLVPALDAASGRREDIRRTEGRPNSMRRVLQRFNPFARAARGPQKWRSRPVLPRNPDVIYAIGDVHGCLGALLELERVIVQDSAHWPGFKLIVMMGDYVDRGPESAGVLAHLSKGPPVGFRRVCLCGNHDDLFLRIFREPSSLHAWLDVGGSKTLQSYGIDFPQLQRELRVGAASATDFIRSAVPPEHLFGLSRLPASLTTPTWFFAHAGARPGVALARQTEKDLMWIRQEFLEAPLGTFDRIVVHGHTPNPNPYIDAARIGVDTGAFGGGGLTAARLTREGVSFLCVKS
jgi:serine/threonine protein phosphatase 1